MLNDRDELNLIRAIDASYNCKDYKHAVGAVVTDKKGNVLSIGWNQNKTHPLQKRFAEEAELDDKIYLHAEIAALVKCKSEDAHTIYVGRVMKNGFWANATPCPICTMAIEEAGIKRVVATSGKGKPFEYMVSNGILIEMAET